METPVKPIAPSIELIAPNTAAAIPSLAPAFGSSDWVVFLTGVVGTSGVRGVSGPPTYLLWLDVSIVSANSQELADYIRKETGLIVSPGIIYRGNGNKFLRLNLASPISMVEDGISRLITGIKKYSKNSWKWFQNYLKKIYTFIEVIFLWNHYF